MHGSPPLAALCFTSECMSLADPTILPRELFGYQVIDLVGQGAGSSIYAVSDPETRQLYALKHVVRRKEKDIRFIQQLESEYEVGKLARHPGLRKCHDVKYERTMLRKITSAALIMELFDGLSMEMDLPAELPEVVRCFIETARALEALHGLGFVHCDLKPNNILLNPAGQVKVIDLGQACKIGTVKQRIQGTPDYISPEQVRREAVTIRTDVFNLGATMYWALSGRKLPTMFTLRKTENSFLLDDAMDTPMAVNPAVPEPLSNLAMECVRSNPSKRPSDMGEVISRLEVIRHGLMQAAMRRQHVLAS